ncbi:hypothetical protein N7530_003704 [Penicillium desertorum]|uniref:Stress-response A/B barrel domain-containing protein n=1 Tax=Penicillium desertorum TaxID=1303715 RepID=A0A9W9WX69_9EURO|nr:hypothetical protein N7530_003704 [Penicillium desertorum]
MAILHVVQFDFKQDVAPATQQENCTHLFILEFDSIEQQEYYKSLDPVHADFASRILPLVDSFKITAFRESDFQGVSELG